MSVGLLEGMRIGTQVKSKHGRGIVEDIRLCSFATHIFIRVCYKKETVEHGFLTPFDAFQELKCNE